MSVITKIDYATAKRPSEQARFHEEVIRETKRRAAEMLLDFVETQVNKIEPKARLELLNIVPKAIEGATEACTPVRTLELRSDRPSQQEDSADSTSRPPGPSTPQARRNSAAPIVQASPDHVAQPISMQRRMTTANIMEDLAELPGESHELPINSSSNSMPKTRRNNTLPFQRPYGIDMKTNSMFTPIQQARPKLGPQWKHSASQQEQFSPQQRSNNPFLRPIVQGASVVASTSCSSPALNPELMKSARSARQVGLPANSRVSPITHITPHATALQNTVQMAMYSPPVSATTSVASPMLHNSSLQHQNSMMATNHNPCFDAPFSLSGSVQLPPQYNQHTQPLPPEQRRSSRSQFAQYPSFQACSDHATYNTYTKKPGQASPPHYNTHYDQQPQSMSCNSIQQNLLKPQASWIGRDPGLHEEFQQIQSIENVRRAGGPCILEETEHQMAQQQDHTNLDFDESLDYFYQGTNQDPSFGQGFSSSDFDWDTFGSFS